jgi:ribosomal-protein-serine acetyltransferase
MDYFIPPDRIDLPEFSVRSYEPGDGALLNEATQSSHEHLKTFMLWAASELPVEESEKLVRRFRGEYLLLQNFALGIFSPDGKQVLGGTGFHNTQAAFDQKSAEIGMWIRASAAGNGLGTKALIALLNWSFTAWPWQRVIWRCDSRNIASIRTAEKAGMRREGYFRSDVLLSDGTWRDTISFAILRTDWLNATPP